MNPFSRASSASDSAADPGFDDWGAFVPENVPDPGPFLAEHDVLAGSRHAAFHALTRECFEQRGVYDATFGYNLAKLNLDRRHPEAGFRYAEDADDPAVLRAEFTPTTEFCPQADALVKGSFRAWNGLRDRHEYDLVRVRVHPSHHQAVGLNDALERLEAEFRETGAVPGESGGPDPGSSDGTRSSPF
ncbi:hypothetical protein ACFO5R_17160 [Halosolutus amylolyticus]|uniref:DUF7998 domain-containing protein n=1 Tax=Halosolutus amylolyticus TaxID=2932267 RepID=A0ABD5PT49_9EURY|nr:hypothetical protein [Halosolutus amylolyticus]